MRRLSVIMFSDFCGYSRAMAADEDQTLRLLREHDQMLNPRVEAWGGRVLKHIGDAILAAFPSAADAAGCALDIQKTLAERNRDADENSQIRIRIGLHAGEVVEEGGDVFGTVVNIAARLEGLASPGGICVSRAIHEALAPHPWPVLASLGLHELKNIPGQFHLYALDPAASALPEPPQPAARAPRGRPGGRWLLAMVVSGVVIAGSLWAWRGEGPSAEDAPAEGDRLVVAVCPFSAEPALEPLARTIQRLVLLELSASPATVAGFEPIGCEVAPGSHEEAVGLRLHPRPQMIIWGDVSSVGEAIALQGRLSLARPVWLLDRIETAPAHLATGDTEALMAGRATASSLTDLVRLVEAAHFRISDPQIALRALDRVGAPTSTSRTLEGMVFYYLDRLGEARSRLEAALELDGDDAIAASALALVHFKAEDWDASIAESERAKAIRPTLSWPYGNLVRLHLATGSLDRAEAEARAGLAMAEESFILRTELATVHLVGGNDTGALAELERVVAEHPNYDHGQLLYLYALLIRGDDAAARAHVQALAQTPPRMRDVYLALVTAAAEASEVAFRSAGEQVSAQPDERRCRASFYAGALHEIAGVADAAPWYAWAEAHCPSWAPHGRLAARRLAGSAGQ